MQSRLLMGVTSRTYYQSPLMPKELHQEILNAIQSQDEVAAERTVREHFVDAQQRAMDGRHHLPVEPSQTAGKSELISEFIWEI
jgi:DNA-binding FadR family transcriptional regulator